MKIKIILLSIIIITALFCVSATAAEFTGELSAKSALLMEASSGKILYEKNADEALPPASVTKIMTLLLVMEAIDEGKISLTDMVETSENAASMGGSQVYLKVGEQMSVEEMIKCVVISSANDCAVALAEFIAGSEDAFVGLMNSRAAELGMMNTVFENTNGLDDTAQNHVTSARDIAIMSRELIKHELILKYSSIWMDTIRNGEFGLTNTNRLVRFYQGANGLKTGSTSRALFCISATAKRGDMQLISVIMAAPTRDERNEDAKKLLDFGFANYSVFIDKGQQLPEISVLGGKKDTCALTYNQFSEVVEKGIAGKITSKIDIPESVRAPIAAGERMGYMIYECDGREVGRADICASEDVPQIGFFELYLRLIKNFCII